MIKLLAQLDVRAAITLILLITFVGIIVFHYSENLEKTLENLLLVAVGYYLREHQPAAK